MRPEAEQKRKDGDRPDRVEGLIESRIQNRMRSRSYDCDRSSSRRIAYRREPCSPSSRR